MPEAFTSIDLSPEEEGETKKSVLLLGKRGGGDCNRFLWKRRKREKTLSLLMFELRRGGEHERRLSRKKGREKGGRRS